MKIENEVLDLKSAIKTVLSNCDVDSNRITLAGSSLGAVVISLAAEKSNVKTLVLWSPAFN